MAGTHCKHTRFAVVVNWWRFFFNLLWSLFLALRSFWRTDLASVKKTTFCSWDFGEDSMSAASSRAFVSAL